MTRRPMRIGFRARRASVSVFQQSRSGSTLRVPGQRRPAIGAMMRMSPAGMRRFQIGRPNESKAGVGQSTTAMTAMKQQLRWEASNPTLSGSLTCWATCGSRRVRHTRRAMTGVSKSVRFLPVSIPFAVVRGTTDRGGCVRRTATTATRFTAASTSDFVLPRTNPFSSCSN